MNNIFHVLLAFLLLSCFHKQKVPHEILPQKKMQEVLWDMIRADEFVLNFALKDSGLNKKEECSKLYSLVFRIHNTSEEHFEKSLHFYQTRPDLFKTILDSLNSKKALEIISPYIPDSIRSKLKTGVSR